VPISPVARMVARYIAGAHHTGRLSRLPPWPTRCRPRPLSKRWHFALADAAAIGVIGKLFKIDGWFYVSPASRLRR
jgi:hypothetical protein